MYLRHRATEEDMRKFLKLFSRNDYVANDHKVGQMLKRKRSFTRRIVYDLRQTRIKLVNVFLVDMYLSEGYRFKSYPSQTSFTS